MIDPARRTELVPERIVAVGDIHGDLDALVRILMGAGLVDDAGTWIGRDCCLVLLGDLIDRGPDSIATMSYVMELEQAAHRSPASRVVALLGNHELLATQGEYLFVHPADVAATAQLRCGALDGLDAVFKGHGPWARWIRSRPAVVRLGATVFVHAGLDRQAASLGIDAINEAVRAWIAHFQGAGPEPEACTEWLVACDNRSPLWTRALMAWNRPSPRALHTRQEIHDVLVRLGAERIVVGHSPTAGTDFRIAWPHPDYGDAVAVIDTGISCHYGGRLSALQIEGSALRPRYFERAGKELAATHALRARFEQTLQQLICGI